MKNNVRLVNSKNLGQLTALLKETGASLPGIARMQDKGDFLLLMADELASPAVNILKQEMLSRGGDAATHKQALVNGIEKSSVLLMGTRRQLSEVAQRLKRQQFSLPALGAQMEAIISGSLKQSFEVSYPGGVLSLGEKTLVMGIVNVTPDSFSDGGQLASHKDAADFALKLVEQGADIVDVGGESTRPGFTPVSVDEEKARILPVIEQLVAKKALVSVDTYKSVVAEAALDAGAVLINDVGGLQKDSEMAALAAARRVPVVVMHWPKEQTPPEGDLMSDMCRFFYRSLEIGKAAGMSDDQFILDPGLGFMKTPAQNLIALRRLSELCGFGLPILVGASRKSFIGQVLDIPVEERLSGTAVAVTLSVSGGAQIVRVHDVKEMSRIVRMTDAVLNS